MKLMVSAMLPSATKRQYSSVLPLLRHCFPVFDKICGMAMNFVFFVLVTVIKIVLGQISKKMAGFRICQSQNLVQPSLIPKGSILHRPNIIWSISRKMGLLSRLHN